MGKVIQDKVPFTADQQSGLEALAGAGQLAVNVIVDAKGAVRRRPGIVAHSLGSATLDANPIVGLYARSDGPVFAAAAALPGAMEIYELNAGGGSNITVGAKSKFIATTRPVFAETEALLAIASGGGLRKIVMAERAIDILEGNPPTASHVIAHGNRLLANDIAEDATKINYSAPAQGTVSYGGHEQWGALVTSLGRSGFFTAEARPDQVVAIGENSNEVFAFGVTNVQTFGGDPNFVYSSVSTREFGCAAPLSVVRDDQSFAWVDDKRRIIHTDGRSVSILSDTIKQTLDDMPDVSGAYGYRMLLGPADCLVWTFPADGTTLAYQRGGGWSQWSSWDSAANVYGPFTVTAHASLRGSNDQLVGTSAGAIGAFSNSAYTDLGATIPASITTGYLDRGTDSRKHCRSLKLTLRRGTTTSTNAPQAFLEYRDDEGAWSAPIKLSLGDVGKRHITVEKRSLGVYRRRQWRFTFHGPEELALASAVEELEILEN